MVAELIMCVVQSCHATCEQSGTTMQVIKRRLHAYQAQAAPVEEYFSSRDMLLDFEITGGIPETLPLLYQSIKPHVGNWNIAELEVGTSAT
jgi:hypothetical protein